jgi:hypothetical protein
MIDQSLIEELKMTLKRGADLEYFFAQLTSSEWAEPLFDAGFFNTPADLIKGDDGVMAPT